MPTYEYACTSCGEHLEVAQSFRDDPLRECPACRGPLRKVFGSIGVVFKGSGFYKTDSRPAAKSGGDKDKAAASTGSDGGGGTDGSKSDTAASAKDKAKDKSAGTASKAGSDGAGSPKSSGSGSKTGTKSSSTAAAS